MEQDEGDDEVAHLFERLVLFCLPTLPCPNTAQKLTLTRCGGMAKQFKGQGANLGSSAPPPLTRGGPLVRSTTGAKSTKGTGIDCTTKQSNALQRILVVQ